MFENKRVIRTHHTHTGLLIGIKPIEKEKEKPPTKDEIVNLLTVFMDAPHTPKKNMEELADRIRRLGVQS